MTTDETPSGRSRVSEYSGHPADSYSLGASRLAPLAPSGTGTPFVESLSSYLMRLAMTHSLPTGALARYVLASQIDALSQDAPRRDAVSSYLRVAHTMNGAGRVAQQWVDALSALTLRSDLAGLTLRAWAEVAHDRNLLAASRRWCPSCLVEWNTSGLTWYEPLVWSIAAGPLCPRHDVPLETVCPVCHRGSRWLSWWSQPGVCSSCRASLCPSGGLIQGQVYPMGCETAHVSCMPGAETIPDAGSAALADRVGQVGRVEQVQIAHLVSDWLTDTSQLAGPIPHERLGDALKRVLPPVHDGGAASLARQLDIPKVTFWGWINARRPMALPALIAICRLLNCTISAFLAQPEVTPARAAPESPVTLPAPLLSPSYSGSGCDRSLVGFDTDGEAAHPELRDAVPASIAPGASSRVPRLHAGRRDQHQIAHIRAAFAQLLASTYESGAATTAVGSSTPSKDGVAESYACRHANSPVMMRITPSSANDRIERSRPLTAREVATCLGVSAPTLKAYAPDLYAQLLEDGRRARAERKRRRCEQVVEQVRQAAGEVVRVGEPPTARRVGQVLKKPGIFRERSAREALAEARLEWME